MRKKLLFLLLILFFLVISIFSMPLVLVHAETGWDPEINITNDISNDDIQSVITYDPTQTRFWHVAWVKYPGEENLMEIMYTNESVWSTYQEQITGPDFQDDYNPMIDMDNNGVVHVVWVKVISPGLGDSGESEIMYANSTNWKNHINVSRQIAKKNWYPTLVVEKDTGIPHIAWQAGYQELPSGEIYYCKGPNGAIKLVVDTQGWSWEPSIDLDKGNIVHLVWTELGIYTSSDHDIRYTNSSVWPATETAGYCNVSDRIENQKDDRRPDIAIDKDNRSHVSWFVDDIINPSVYYTFSITQLNNFFATPVDISGPDYFELRPSIKVSTEYNPVIIFERDLQADEIYARDYNGSGGTHWVAVDISNTLGDDSLKMSSIGALDIDRSDCLCATFYSEIGGPAPIWDVYVVEGKVVGKGIPGFELVYLMMTFMAITIIWYYLRRRSMKPLYK